MLIFYNFPTVAHTSTFKAVDGGFSIAMPSHGHSSSASVRPIIDKNGQKMLENNKKFPSKMELATIDGVALRNN